MQRLLSTGQVRRVPAHLVGIFSITIVVILAVPLPAAAQIYCRDFGADPGDDRDDFVFLQNCLNNAPPGSTVILDPGSPGYIINSTLTFASDNLTITSSQAPAQRATIIAGQSLSAMMLEQPNPGLTFHILYVTFDGMVDTPGWRVGGCSGNVFLRGNRFEFAHNEVKHSCTGLGLAIAGDEYTLWDNYVAYNGTDKYNGFGTWSDGMTILRCNGGSIHDNVLVDNTDIDLVVGGGPFCSVQDNTIWHGGKYAFAGLNIGTFGDSGPYAGIHYGSVFAGNSITSVAFNRLGQGLSVGSHPWPDGIDVWIRDTGTVTGNTISGANVNLLIEGFGIPNPNTGGIDPAPGSIFGNDPHDPMGDSDCANAYNYAVNPDHAVGAYDGGYTVLRWDGDVGCVG